MTRHRGRLAIVAATLVLLGCGSAGREFKPAKGGPVGKLNWSYELIIISAAGAKPNPAENVVSLRYVNLPGIRGQTTGAVLDVVKFAGGRDWLYEQEAAIGNHYLDVTINASGPKNEKHTLHLTNPQFVFVKSTPTPAGISPSAQQYTAMQFSFTSVQADGKKVTPPAQFPWMMWR